MILKNGKRKLTLRGVTLAFCIIASVVTLGGILLSISINDIVSTFSGFAILFSVLAVALASCVNPAENNEEAEEAEE